MGRLFAGTPWDRPLTCERCGQPESACQCPPVEEEPELIPPAMDQPKLPVPDSASVGAEGEVEGPAKPRQNSSSVRSVKALSRASGLAK